MPNEDEIEGKDEICKVCGQVFEEGVCHVGKSDAASSTQPQTDCADCEFESAVHAAHEHPKRDWRTMGIVELACENQSVSDYIEHWEGRALKAEAQLAASRTVERPRAHKSRMSDSSLYDEVCVECGMTDAMPNWNEPCPKNGEREGASRENADRRDSAEQEQNKADVVSPNTPTFDSPSLRNERSAEVLEREGAEREAFEKWVGHALPVTQLRFRNDGRYADATIEMLWQSWQAAYRAGASRVATGKEK